MKINGKNIILRTVEIEDAEFIYEMRKNESKTRYLSKITGSIQDQKEWIKTYKLKESEKKEFYFIIESKLHENLGLVRIYDFVDDSFCWGSWLIKENAPRFTAIESALLIYEFSFYQLGFKKSHFDVRKENLGVIAFHQRFGATITDEDELNYYFEYSKENYEKIKPKYKRYL